MGLRRAAPPDKEASMACGTMKKAPAKSTAKKPAAKKR